MGNAGLVWTLSFVFSVTDFRDYSVSNWIVDWTIWLFLDFATTTSNQNNLFNCLTEVTNWLMMLACGEKESFRRPSPTYLGTRYFRVWWVVRLGSKWFLMQIEILKLLQNFVWTSKTARPGRRCVSVKATHFQNEARVIFLGKCKNNANEQQVDYNNQRLIERSLRGF